MIAILAIYYLLMLTVGAIGTSENATVNQLLIWVGTPFIFVLVAEHITRTHARMSSESIRLIIFLLFVLQSRMYSIDLVLFDKAFRKVLLNIFLFVAVEYIIYRTGEIKTFFIATLVGVTFLCTYMIYAPTVENSVIEYEGFKIENEMMNTNGLANYAVEGLLAFLFLWQNLKPKAFKYISLLSLPAIVLTIIGAASKAGLLGAVTTVILWVFLCLRVSMRDRLTLIGIIFVSIVLLLFANEYILENTYLGQRIKDIGQINKYYENDSRGQLISIGLSLFMEHPFFGIGLMQVASNNERAAYSHNEYVEILSNFGLIGAFIYFPFLLIMWNRLTRSIKMIKTGYIDTQYNLNFMKVMFIVLLIRGISVPLLTSYDEMILLGVIGGYSLYCEEKLTSIFSFNHRITAR